MIKNNKKEKGYITFQFEIKGNDWKKILERAKTSIQANVDVPGFRKGKAPKHMLDKYVGKDKVFNKAINIAIDTSDELKKVLADIMKNENIITQPTPMVEKISDTELLISFKGILFPEIKLGSYKGLKYKKDIIKIDPNEIEFQYSQFMKHIKEFKELDKGKVEMGDSIIMNFKGFVDKKAFPGGEAENYELIIGSKSFIEGFEEQMIGMEIGSKKDINVTFPKDYALSPELANKPAKFEVSISSIKREIKQTIEQENEKLQKFGFKSSVKLKEEIKDMVKKDKEDVSNNKFQEAIIKEILDQKETIIEIPKELIETEIEQRKKMFEQQLEQQGMTLEKYAKNVNKSIEDITKESIKPEAVNRIKTSLIINHIAKVEKIQVSDKDIEQGLEEQAKFQRIPVEKLKEIIKMDILITNLLHDKVIDYLANLK